MAKMAKGLLVAICCYGAVCPLSCVPPCHPVKHFCSTYHKDLNTFRGCWQHCMISVIYFPLQVPKA